ncbi:UNVERIFIED_CONTAM: hypothetical protein K2H54_003237 [Gekko kuhli]
MESYHIARETVGRLPSLSLLPPFRKQEAASAVTLNPKEKRAAGVAREGPRGEGKKTMEAAAGGGQADNSQLRLLPDGANKAKERK